MYTHTYMHTCIHTYIRTYIQCTDICPCAAGHENVPRLPDFYIGFIWEIETAGVLVAKGTVAVIW